MQATWLQPTWYEIRIREALDEDWAGWFEGMEIRREADARTIFSGPVADQAALHGLLARVRDLNLTLISVNAVLPPEPPAERRE